MIWVLDKPQEVEKWERDLAALEQGSAGLVLYVKGTRQAESFALKRAWVTDTGSGGPEGPSTAIDVTDRVRALKLPGGA